ncbi:MAG: putative pre6S rRNA nuclease [Patescibacteria group bacterium]|jgi:putative Holliday junction resolvase|nr:putative pre6S rRNA nuclease [Patescibacteria group bacterium]
MKTLGLDYGKKRIGVALSDDDSRIAFPYSVLDNKNNLIEIIVDLSKKEGFKDIALGDPGDNSIKDEVILFMEVLKKEGFNVFLEKEFMTSLHTDMFTKKKPIARKTKQKREPKKDESAAALILQRFLDKKEFKK